MLTETGRVVAVEPEWLWVETIRQSTCGSCSASKGCGHGLMNQAGDGRRSYLKVSCAAFPEGRFKIDDEVCIAIPEHIVMGGSFVLYMVPLLTTLAVAGAWFAMVPEATDLGTIAGATIGFCVGLGLVRLHAWWRGSDPAFNPRLLGPALSIAR
ncbi:MAG: SoxR reducing system RseC family protein [Pseudomonadota bacterium]